jgi:uncharacterized membrane protein
VVAGILWIGLLYYFNFVQIRVMPNIPGRAEAGDRQAHRPRGPVLVPLGRAGHGAGRVWASCWRARPRLCRRGHELRSRQGLTEGRRAITLLGIGVWLAIIMFLNVWGIIWPNQKRALGIVVVDDDKKARAARVAMLGSRTNLLLSLPMLTSMAMYQTLFG